MIKDGPKVCKFGGELKDPASFKLFREITLVDPTRRYIVVSALGGDERMTTMLYAWSLPFGTSNEKVAKLQEKYGNDRNRIFAAITDRYTEIASGLNITGFDIPYEFELIRTHAERLKHESPDALHHFAASRGEWCSGQLFARYGEFRFQDSASFITFTEQGVYDAELTRLRAEEIGLDRMADDEVVVIGGFYGSSLSGRIFTFDLGGTDRTMSITGSLTKAGVCENWKKTPKSATPEIMPSTTSPTLYLASNSLTFSVVLSRSEIINL